jgi:hypothetical protein
MDLVASLAMPFESLTELGGNLVREFSVASSQYSKPQSSTSVDLDFLPEFCTMELPSTLAWYVQQ